MRNLLVLIFFAFFAVERNVVASYKILGVFPTAAPSHHIVGSALMRGLAADGHEVTIISPFKEKNPIPNYTEVHLEGIHEMFTADEEQAKNMFTFHSQPFWKLLPTMFDMGVGFTAIALNHPRFKEFLKKDAQFDVVIVEIFLSESLLALGHHFNAPVIGLSTFGASKWTTDLVGTPNIPSYVPHTFNGLSDKMTFAERAINLFYYWYEDIAMPIQYTPRQQELIDKYFPGENLPTIEELKRNVSLVLLNTHVTLGTPRPYAPNMIEVGGMHIEREVKPLPANLQKFLDDAKDGAIFFSLGSNVKFSKMPAEKQSAILNSFQEYPKMRLLLKLDENATVSTHKASDVLIQSWLPQQSILAHPNVKLFVTHGGLLSTMETIYFGKPVVGIPIFGDQHLNMKLASLKGYGEGLPYAEFNENEFKRILHKVLSTPRYAVKAKITSERYNDQIRTPMEIAVHWVKHVAKNKGAPHLHSTAVDLPFTVYYNLDVYAVLFAIVAFILFALTRIFRAVCSKLFSGSANAKKTKSKTN